MPASEGELAKLDQEIADDIKWLKDSKTKCFWFVSVPLGDTVEVRNGKVIHPKCHPILKHNRVQQDDEPELPENYVRRSFKAPFTFFIEFSIAKPIVGTI